ncbi:MAG: hypothetical protein C5T88_02860 [Williamsoniiplasma luminosum]|uniref:Uncharacterized protein n=1 Tax=Williamsoniiplasma luminosum TaxID=214888 RepID=A0A2S0NKE2_9MOLU|nr:MAG: hypothetical protein C5T88_02860 [Williamsoniiplasma luminosum]
MKQNFKNYHINKYLLNEIETKRVIQFWFSLFKELVCWLLQILIKDTKKFNSNKSHQQQLILPKLICYEWL